ncbi:hypothetical protein ACVIIY_004047 [Bradyrhizobium sp. USDA 4515]
MHSNGGCDFAADPQDTALAQPIFWTPQVDPAAILLEAGPAASEGFHLTADALRSYASVGRSATLLQLHIRDQRYDVSLAAHTDEPIAAVVPLDELTPDRLTALARFWAAVRGRRVPPDPRLTPQRRQRARQMLRAVDARQAGAVYRVVAEHLFPQHKIDAASWVGDPIREITIRLARDGMKLVRGGYRTLLRRPRRDR